MYERFQQRLQKEGLADAEGNPTEKTLEIRRQIVEKKVEREKQAERQKKIAKRAKTTKHCTDGKGGWCCVGCGSVRFWGEYDERGESDSVGGDD